MFKHTVINKLITLLSPKLLSDVNFDLSWWGLNRLSNLPPSPWNLLALWTEVKMFPRMERGERGAWAQLGEEETRRVNTLTTRAITGSRASSNIIIAMAIHNHKLIHPSTKYPQNCLRWSQVGQDWECYLWFHIWSESRWCLCPDLVITWYVESWLSLEPGPEHRTMFTITMGLTVVISHSGANIIRK